MKMTKLLCIGLLLFSLAMTNVASAETDFMEAAAPAGTCFQYFTIYQHGEDFARDDTPVKDLDVDAVASLFRIAKWWEDGVIHAIIPATYASQEGDIVNASPAHEIDGSDFGIGDAYIGGAKRWISEDKTSYLLAGADLKLPTGDYNSDNDINLGSGSLAIQPFVILTKIYNKGAIATDTEIRLDINTTVGPVDHAPDDVLEVWQTLHMGITKDFRAGIALKGEFDAKDNDGDDDNSMSISVGPQILYQMGKTTIWSKVLFNVHSEDTLEDAVTAYIRISMPF